MLRQKGIVKPCPPPVADNACSKIAAGFHCYLVQDLGRSPSTAKNYVPFIAQFLMERFQNRTPDLALLRAPDVTGFVTRHAHQLSPVRAGIMVTALRSSFDTCYTAGQSLPIWLDACPLSPTGRFLPCQDFSPLLQWKGF